MYMSSLETTFDRSKPLEIKIWNFLIGKVAYSNEIDILLVIHTLII